MRRHWPLLLALLAGLVLRGALWGQLPRVGLISDEAEYLASADWLAAGRGFAWHTQYLWTRAPLYPIFLALHLKLFGTNLAPIFASQTALSLGNVVLVYLLTLRVAGNHEYANVTMNARMPGEPRIQGGRRAAGVAALLAALYLPLATYAQLLLSETLFTTLLLAALLLLVRWAAGRRGAGLALGGAGVLLGLATLTRGLTLGFLPLATLWALAVARHHAASAQSWLRTLGRCWLLPVACGLVIAPWTFYASRAYGGLVVIDTTGAFNLALGARTAYDGGRSDEPTRNFVLALLDPAQSADERRALLAERRDEQGNLVRAGACLYGQGDPRLEAALEQDVRAISQAERQQLLSAEASCLIQARPLAFVGKSLGELIDLFQINYTGDERLSGGFALGRLPGWYARTLFLLDDTLYLLALPLAALGWATLRITSRRHWTVYGGSGGARQVELLRRRPSPVVGLIGLWLLYNLAAAPLLFAINRFRVPLMPLAFVLAGWALADWPRLLAALRNGYGALCAVLATLLLLVAATPYAYLEPRAAGAASRWASYLGPYPSSLEATRRALGARPGYLREQELAGALQRGDLVAAQQLLSAPELPSYAAAVGTPLLDGLAGQPEAGLQRLAKQPVQPLEDWQRSLVAGELLRQLGELEAARREFGPEHVDNVNPVAWAWQWLRPPPAPNSRIDLAGDNDLGYIDGFYLGGFDPNLDATTRWASGTARLRFPGAANGKPQRLCLAASALGWLPGLPLPSVDVALGDAPLGRVALGTTLQETCLTLPVRSAGDDFVITLRSPTFVPDALDLLAQQGPQVGQLRLLGFQLDWAEVR